MAGQLQQQAAQRVQGRARQQPLGHCVAPATSSCHMCSLSAGAQGGACMGRSDNTAASASSCASSSPSAAPVLLLLLLAAAAPSTWR